MDIDYKKAGTRVKLRRREKNLTQEQLAELCDVSNTYISHIETGIAHVSLDVLYKIGLALETTPDYFLVDTVKSAHYVNQELSRLLEQCTPDTLYTITKLIEVLLDAQNRSQ